MLLDSWATNALQSYSVVQHFGDWCKVNDVHIDKDDPLKEEPSFNSVSSLPIPYPLPTHLKSVHDQHERGGREFPLQLVPHYSSTRKCEHSNLFCSADPVQNGWIVKKGCVIHKETVNIEDENRTIYYRPSVGSCSCKQAYDGQEDLLFNLDNKHPFHYGYLFQYLHLMLEGKNPLGFTEERRSTSTCRADQPSIIRESPESSPTAIPRTFIRAITQYSSMWKQRSY